MDNNNIQCSVQGESHISSTVIFAYNLQGVRASNDNIFFLTKQELCCHLSNKRENSQISVHETRHDTSVASVCELCNLCMGQQLPLLQNVFLANMITCTWLGHKLTQYQWLNRQLMYMHCTQMLVH